MIVIGAGLAGLTAGATAAAGGATTVVLEAHQSGGRARTTGREGFVFNMGAHALFAGGPGSAVLRRLGVAPAGSRPPRQLLALDGERLGILPSGPVTLLRSRLIGRRDKARFARILGGIGRLDSRRFADRSVAQFIADTGASATLTPVLRALVRTATYCDEVEQSSADAAIAQLQLAARHGVRYLHGGWGPLLASLGTRVEVRPGAAVRALHSDGGLVEVFSDDRRLLARSVIVATGTPDAVRAVLPHDPGWGDLGAPATAACLDLALASPPQPGYLMALDAPLFATTQSPPGRQAPEGRAVLAVLRYGARSATQDRPQLEAMAARAGAGSGAADIVHQRFLARMVVAGTVPAVTRGGLAGRPRVADSGLPGVFVAGDWVGPDGLLADAAMASGYAAALEALRYSDRVAAPAARLAG